MLTPARHDLRAQLDTNAPIESLRAGICRLDLPSGRHVQRSAYASQRVEQRCSYALSPGGLRDKYIVHPNDIASRPNGEIDRISGHTDNFAIALGEQYMQAREFAR